MKAFAFDDAIVKSWSMRTWIPGGGGHVRTYANYYAIICSVAPLDTLGDLDLLDPRLIIIIDAMAYDYP